jgi:hypothetical protein
MRHQDVSKARYDRDSDNIRECIVEIEEISTGIRYYNFHTFNGQHKTIDVAAPII